ncbi:hypothetical protein B0T24DRAFT_681897 [Lasiosphaeria ovina]|uniref:PD-(D/E)XK nuclease-like domain-containing protein n=1 Tax=Lasiosphaeria ovina TaxID=92902 RepID=A0AAE0JZ32_9PEZI|nr:hypothetical protein B0T24DRAFT_681897 [Lasiosphaeria ovina]
MSRLPRAAHRCMQCICRNSRQYHDRMGDEDEPGWNDLVHCRVLEEALEGCSGVGFRTVTASPTAGLAELLADMTSEDVDITHCALSDLAPTPLDCD